jgi:hypothetical protein
MNKIEDMLLSQNSPMLQYFNAPSIRYTLNEHAKGFNHERKIFLLLSIYYWLINHG